MTRRQASRSSFFRFLTLPQSLQRYVHSRYVFHCLILSKIVSAVFKLQVGLQWELDVGGGVSRIIGGYEIE